MGSMDMIDHVYFGNALGDWLLAATAFLVCFFVLPSIRLFVVARSRKLVGREAPSWINLVLLLITRTRRLFLVVVAFYVAERFLVLPQRIEDLSTALIVLTFWIQAALWGVAAVEFALKQRQDRMIAAGELKQSGSMSVLLFVARVAIFALAVLLALDNLGVNITALVAGLGIGGIAIALAVQTVLGDLLASLSITLDKPFRVGDLLRIDDIEGVVEFIGVRSTRLRSVTGEQVIIANADLLKNRLRNLGRMPERRMLFTLGIAYETSPDKLATVSDIVRRAVESVQGTRFEYCAMRGFGDSSLNFEVVYFVPDWDQARLRFIKINDEVNRAIHAAFAAEGVVFAYPTRSVIVRQ
ncbi:MAG: mechanosensitive ion channel family protein [Gammaproteobacteria bacterium]|jgi:small-conductance mechanosensitive channel|nr:mechanosensitive ion channel family protein [Gammaproteobacteria bacterium]